MTGLVIGFVVVVIVVRLVLDRRLRKRAGLSADRAAFQPLTEWSARFPIEGGGKRRRRQRGF